MIKNSCVLKRNRCFFCVFRIESIEGITEMKDYFSIVLNRTSTQRALFFATMSLIISIGLLVLSIIDAF